MSAVTITINGQKVSARAGQTVLRAAQAAGIEIPTLCHHPALAPIGACRVCLVEVKGQRTLQPACTFPVADRMEIQTESEKVVRARRFVLELLFSERNHFCMVCEMSGGCELQDLGYRYKLDHWMYPTYTQRFPVGRLAAAPPHGPQPLRPLPALRARLQRAGRQPHARPPPARRPYHAVCRHGRAPRASPPAPAAARASTSARRAP